jgi:hypothetical protein
MFITLALYGLLDHFFSSTFPKILFGTKHLSNINDLIYKKMAFAFFLGILTNGFLTPIIRLFEPKT